MRYGWVAATILASAALVVAGFAGCQVRRESAQPSLARIQPETRERMKLVMAKVGKYYEMLAGSVDKGHLSDAAGQAEAIAALGTYLAPHRDPAMPPAYITRQAEFDEAARELALAARLKTVQDVSERFDEMTTTCRNCHAAFRVALEAPYKELGFVGH